MLAHYVCTLKGIVPLILLVNSSIRAAPTASDPTQQRQWQVSGRLAVTLSFQCKTIYKFLFISMF